MMRRYGILDKMLEKFKAELQARGKICIIVKSEKDKIKDSLLLEPFSGS